MKITIEVDSYAELLSFAATLLPFATMPSATTEHTATNVPHTGNGAAEPQDPAPAAPKAARAPRNKKADDLAKQAEEAAKASTLAAQAGTPGTAAGTAPAALPPLETLKHAITVAARAAMKNEGSKTILDLLPAFRDATGLDFVMHAQEEHRAALFQLAQQAGIELV